VLDYCSDRSVVFNGVSVMFDKLLFVGLSKDLIALLLEGRHCDEWVTVLCDDV